ncbi:exo-beta-1,4-galactosidase [Wenyingzhuangia marina]|uniref:beta-galactosidase n=1 Tax=Wenyingzhuangia marina TaxID=1195760 RepID=A0A1M5UIQ4_9FLAO|nr:sugar-binding domain-containing protein [Wenyingzhuangia marina]SHH62523.1 Glycosyl hydrolases family 2 [Wenyingzhuangia marina]
MSELNKKQHDNMVKKYLYFSLLLLTIFTLSSFKEGDEIDLKGTWHFEIDRKDEGVLAEWFKRDLKDLVKLPGSMAKNLKGDDITLSTNWTGTIYDSSFYFRASLEKFRQPDNIHIPFWLTPAKHYVGAAWYQKEVTIPKNWRGKHVILHLERTHIETRVWINDQEVGLQNSLVAPHEYDLSAFLKPGKQRITIRVDNRDKINVGPDSHSISDHTQGNWNGIIGKMALESFAPVYIEDVEVYPDIKNRKAKVTIDLKNTSLQNFKGKVCVQAKSFNSDKSDKTKEVSTKVAISKNENQTVTIELPFGKGMLTWDEFDPALYRLEVTLTSKKVKQTKEVTFGMREFSIKGNQFLINGTPVFLRGTLNNCEFPLTGYPATTVDAWKKIFNKAKDFGLNHVRFHSWCPPEAAFMAADLVGIYLQPEGPTWTNHGPKLGRGQPIDQYIYDETLKMNKYYGNYASFVMLSAGNEPSGNQVSYLNKFVDFWKEKDSRHVYTGMSVGGSWPVVPNAEFQVRGGVRGVNWKSHRPETVEDFSKGIAPFIVPFVAHEVGQYCVFPNFDEIKKYTGVYKAKNFEMFQQDLIDHHMGDQAKDFLNASGKLQVLSYKTDIEKMLRTPGYAGFQLLGLQDFPGQGSAIIGVLDAFWEEKGYVTAKEYSRFCNQTVPLAEISKFVYQNNETFKATVELFHSGKAPLENAVIHWTIKNEAGQILKSSQFDAKTYDNGNGMFVGSLTFPLEAIQKASKLNLEVSVQGTNFVNDWDFWVYPIAKQKAVSTVYYTTSLDAKAKEILEKGGNVFLNASGKVIKGKEVQMYFQPVFWNTSWFKMRPPHVTGMLIQEDSPAFADFPTSYHSDLQWWEIQNRAQVMNLEGFPSDFRPLIQPIDTWFMNRRLAMVFEAKVGNGKIMVSSADISAEVKNKPASLQLYRSLIDYMDSYKFEPKNELNIEIIEELFKSPSKELFDTFTKDSPDELKPNSNQNK